MKKGWRIVIVIVLVALLLGAVSIGVGMMTGADFDRIYAVVDDRYNLSAWIDYYTQVYNIISSELYGISTVVY